jgi:hypothetical protein
MVQYIYHLFNCGYSLQFLVLPLLQCVGSSPDGVQFRRAVSKGILSYWYVLQPHFSYEDINELTNPTSIPVSSRHNK